MSTLDLVDAPLRSPEPVAGPRPGTEAALPQTWVDRGSAAYWRISVALFFAGFSSFSLIYAVQPILPNLAAAFAVSPAKSSLALSLATGFLAIGILCSGAVSEAVGRRGLMFASMTVSAVLHIGSAVATDWHLMLVLRALEGFALGGVPAVAMAYLAEEIHPRSLASAMGLYVGGTAFGAMMGRVGMGLLTDLGSWRIALGTLGMIDLAGSLGFLALLPPSRNFTRRAGVDFARHRDAWLGHLRTPGLPLLFLTGFLVLGVFVTTFNYLTFRLTAAPYNLSQAQISSIFTVFLFGVVASPTAGLLAERIGRFPVMLAGVLITAAGIALTLHTALPAIIAGVIVVTIGFFVTHSVASGWVGSLARSHKGHASSLYLLAYYLGSSTMGSAGGWFWSEGGWMAVVGFNGGLLAAALAVALRLRRI